MAGAAPKFFCDNCGWEVASDEKTCPHCGRYFSSIRCPSCGFVGDEELFNNGCPKCGYSAAPGKAKGAGKAKKRGLFGSRRKRKQIKAAIKKGRAAIEKAGGKAPAKKASDAATAFWVYAVTAIVFIAAVWGLLSYMKK
jgi:predicted RNA-binding Zn-ribbon protein involved in translation (DUF1610 family)